MSLERRQFIQGLGFSAAALSLPGWMQACASKRAETTLSVVGESRPPAALEDPPRNGRDALELARSRGRPLLVIVVPDSHLLRNERGDLFGVYLNYAEDEALADLALCDVWCARPRDIRTDLASAAVLDQETLAVLVETDGRAPRSVDGPVQQVSPPGFQALGDGERFERDLRARNRWLAERLRAVILPDENTLERRVEAIRRTHTDAEWRALGGPLDRHTRPTRELAACAPAWVRWRSQFAAADERAQWTQLLVHHAKARWRDLPPPPARWASSTGCGMRIEGLADHGSYCGMGFTPAISSRFLLFYAEND